MSCLLADLLNCVLARLLCGRNSASQLVSSLVGPPGDSDASRDSAVALSVGKNLNNSIEFHYLFSASVRLFSLNVVI